MKPSLICATWKMNEIMTISESNTDIHDFKNSSPLEKNCNIISTMKNISRIKLMYQNMSEKRVPSVGLKASSARITKHNMIVIVNMKSYINGNSMKSLTCCLNESQRDSWCSSISISSSSHSSNSLISKVPHLLTTMNQMMNYRGTDLIWSINSPIPNSTKTVIGLPLVIYFMSRNSVMKVITM